MSRRHTASSTIEIQSFVCCFPLKTAQNAGAVVAKAKKSQDIPRHLHNANIARRWSRIAVAYVGRRFDR